MGKCGIGIVDEIFGVLRFRSYAFVSVALKVDVLTVDAEAVSLFQIALGQFGTLGVIETFYLGIACSLIGHHADA